jgi:hypothetical protein
LPKRDYYIRYLCLSVCLTACPSVRPNGTTLLLIDGFSSNFIFDYISKISEENSRLIKIFKRITLLHMRGVVVKALSY